MDQQTFRAVLAQCFSVMDEPGTLYVINPFSLGDMIVIGGFMHALKEKFGVRSVVIIAAERLRQFEITFDGVDEIKYLPLINLSVFREYVYATGKYVDGNYFYAHYRLDHSRNYIYGSGKNFIERFKNAILGLPFETPYHAPTIKDISEDAKQRLRREYVLDGTRTVILSPHANSWSPLSPTVWSVLIDHLTRRGFVVYTNVGRKADGSMELPLEGTEAMNVGLNEIFYIAERVRLVVGLRSGLFDLLGFSNARLICVAYPGQYHDDLGWFFPQSKTIRTLYFVQDFAPQLQELLTRHDVSDMSIARIKHAFIPDEKIFWTEDQMLQALVRTIDQIEQNRALDD